MFEGWFKKNVTTWLVRRNYPSYGIVPINRQKLSELERELERERPEIILGWSIKELFLEHRFEKGRKSTGKLSVEPGQSIRQKDIQSTAGTSLEGIPKKKPEKN